MELKELLAHLVGENSAIAAGAIVTKDVRENAVVCGVPARVIKTVTNIGGTDIWRH